MDEPRFTRGWSWRRPPHLYKLLWSTPQTRKLPEEPWPPRPLHTLPGAHHKRKLPRNLEHLGLFTNFSIDNQINATKPSRRRWPPRVINSRTLTWTNRCGELKPMQQMQSKVKQRMLNSLSQSHKMQLKKVGDWREGKQWRRPTNGSKIHPKITLHIEGR